MREFKVTNAEELFSLKAKALKELKTMEFVIDSIFAAVQNEGIVITDEDLQTMSEQLGVFGDAYDEIDELLLQYVKAIIDQEVVG